MTPKLQIFRDSIVSQSPEQNRAQRKPNQIQKKEPESLGVMLEF